MKEKINAKKILFTIIALVILVIFSKMMLRGTGIGHPSVREITLICLFFIILSSSKKAYWYLGSLFIAAYVIYTPIGLTFGVPTYQYLASLIATDALETTEFFTQIPVKNYFSSLVILAGFIVFKKIITIKSIHLYRNKTLMICLVIIALINQSPFQFFNESYQSFVNLKNEVNSLSDLTKKSEWGQSKLNNSSIQYDDYVLIIGESVRRDYMGMYGYPINNTPFLSKVNGTIVEGLTAGGTNTISSLRLMLTVSNKSEFQPNYGLNFIDLAKSAGIKTYWLSNQGFIGEYDTPISFIASRSDTKKFIKIGAYNSSNTSDFELVSIFKNELNSKVEKKQKRLFIVHLYGSHPDACGRIEDYNNPYITKDEKYNNISCYVTSIQKTDAIIEKVYNLLGDQEKRDGRTFSILYFSDHGLSHSLVNNEIRMNLSNSTAKVLDIPLIKISSDDKERIMVKNFKSGLLFVDGLANWLGINNSKIDSNHSLFTPEDDPTDYGLYNKYSGLKNSENDLPIDIREK
jgi:glucan phosphoethanolaminetransferase (alkaline phosphatase superfamily)